ncbi:MAG: hypothetical protein AAGM22_30330 [Acidobacteriota bacterium]
MHLFRLFCGLLAVAWLSLLIGCAASEEPASDDPAPAAQAEPQSAAEATPDEPPGACVYLPYVERVLAAKDAFTSTANFLRCEAGSYALCYYSGPSPLPCVPGEGATGDCQCQVFEASPEEPMYVEIGGILSECIYNETVAACGEDGSGCSNMCADKPHGPGCQGTTPQSTVAPACRYVASNTFNPSADYISTFSFATVYAPGTDDAFKISSTSENGQYAGCMTAPCTGSSSSTSGTYTTCACPLWPPDGGDAPYQYGRACTEGETNPQSPGYCQLEDGQMWSAAVSEIQSFVESDVESDAE